MSYPPIKIAHFFLMKGQKEEISITPLKLQKLLYFAHGWHLALGDVPLLDEDIGAWRYGPVIPSIYHKFKEYRDEPIQPIMPEWYVNYQVKEPITLSMEEVTLGKFLTDVWEIYGQRSAINLSSLTHLPGTPWRKIYEKYEGSIPYGQLIPNQDIREYFQREWDVIHG